MAELEIQHLLETIKNEGIEKGEAEKQKIIQDAKNEAQKIIENAKNEAQKIIQDAKEEINTFQNQSITIIKQAQNNVCLDLKSKLIDIISSVFKKELGIQLMGANIITLVREIIKDKRDEGYILSVSDSLVADIRSKLVNQIPNIEVEAIGNNEKGFKLSLKDGSGYYDFTLEELVNMLTPYITKSVNNILENKDNTN